MFENFKRLNEKLNFPTIGKIKIIKKLKNNLNNKNMFEGHYQSVASVNTDSPDIIRIIGPSKRDDYWASQEGKEYSTYELAEYYVKLNFSASQEGNKPKLSSKLFEGLNELVEQHKNIVEPQKQPNQQIKPTQITEEITPVVNNPHMISKPIQPAPIVDEISFDEKVIDKLNIDKMNEKYISKTGEAKYIKPTIILPLEVEFDYDLKRLAQTIELLDLDEKDVINFLVEKTTNKFKNIFKNSLKELLLNITNDNVSVDALLKKQIKPIDTIQTTIQENSNNQIETQKEKPNISENKTSTEQPEEHFFDTVNDITNIKDINKTIQQKTEEVESTVNIEPIIEPIIEQTKNEQIINDGLLEVRETLKKYYIENN